MSTLLVFLATAAIASNSQKPIAADIAWTASGEFCEPETVLALPDDTLLISNVCDFQQPDNGFLSLLNADGSVINWRILEGLDSPLGLAMVADPESGNRLYVIDNNHLKIFSWPGYAPIQSIELETAVANDLAVSDDGLVYVSDTAKGQVILVRPDGTQSVLTGNAQFKGANGMAITGNQLYIGGERLWRLDLQDNSVETVGPPWITDIDGIEFEHDGTLQLTPVGGPFIRYLDQDDIEVITGPGVSSANHGFAPNLRLALIPTGYDNTVIAIKIPTDQTPAQNR